MAMLNSCLCCSLLTASIFNGITCMVLYLMSFGLEMWWIVEADVRLPIPAYLLALSYFFLSVLSMAMLTGLRTKRTRLLLAWILFTLLILCPEAGMVLFMAIYYWEGNTYGIIELGMWIFRIIFSISGMICVQSLYSRWRDHKSVLRSLNELNVTNGTFIPQGIGGEYQAKHIEAGFGYQNSAFAHSQPHLSPITKYAQHHVSQQNLKRSLSSVSHHHQQYLSASRLSLAHMAADPLPVPYNASQLTGYQRNEFDTAKFETGLAFRAASQFDLPSFGLDPDEPIFVTGPYGRGGLSSGYGQQAADFYTRPFSALSGSQFRYHSTTSGAAASPNKWQHQQPPPSSIPQPGENSLQWYRPRSLVNLDDDSSSIWSGMGNGRPPMDFATQSLDRRKFMFGDPQRAQSMGALNFGYVPEDGIIRGSVTQPFTHFTNGTIVTVGGDSKQSLGQFSDHIDQYRDVAL